MTSKTNVWKSDIKHRKAAKSGDSPLSGRDERITLRLAWVAQALISHKADRDTPVSLSLVVKPPSRRFKSCARLSDTEKPPNLAALLYLVGTRGFEPPTSCTPCKRSTRLNYVPNFSTPIIRKMSATSKLTSFVPAPFVSLAALRFLACLLTNFRLPSKIAPPSYIFLYITRRKIAIKKFRYFYIIADSNRIVRFCEIMTTKNKNLRILIKDAEAAPLLKV